ncbi:hypothetical protein LTR37_006612 [Vermiconidia calcicola]|uniref:Uncharacterized protein n=1 Tax=Vermiconidia calcicola TaxID=1690605 RepID=A0ACC3NG29_9PEZI|nr:hypothetical protein LTR37_006612 [Vermiconidia calcicola]
MKTVLRPLTLFLDHLAGAKVGEVGGLEVVVKLYDGKPEREAKFDPWSTKRDLHTIFDNVLGKVKGLKGDAKVTLMVKHEGRYNSFQVITTHIDCSDIHHSLEECSEKFLFLPRTEYMYYWRRFYLTMSEMSLEYAERVAE